MHFSKRWQTLLEKVDYAFQPIVNAYSGQVYAVEALIRNVHEAGFESIDALFDAAYHERILFELEIRLRHIAFEKFTRIPFHKEIKLFYNLDNRTTTMPGFKTGMTAPILEAFNLGKEAVCFELSEKHQDRSFATIDQLTMNIYKQQGYRMAIDDFGVGYSGLQTLYNAEPDFIKIDRFFVDGIASSSKRRLFVQSIVEIAQSLGIGVIAEGVETREDFLTCRNLGCNLIQGFFIAKPSKKIDKLLRRYAEIEVLYEQEKREAQQGNGIEAKLERLDCIKESASLHALQEFFTKNKHARLLPVVREDMSPCGVILEESLKEYTYSPFGWSLLQNQTKGCVKNLITPCPSVEVNDSLEKILRIYSHDQGSEGVLVAQNGVYAGYLSAKVLLDVVNEKNLLHARDQNPLTGLLGNRAISEYISTSLFKEGTWALVYFDLDNFKPFNDYYGFRNGDRVIKLLADMIKKASNKLGANALAGHIGGDDFFLGWQVEGTFEEALEQMQKIVEKFGFDVQSFYSKQDREKGYILAKDRHDQERKFPLLSVSAAMLIIEVGKEARVDEEAIGLCYADLKKTAKNAKGGIVASASLL